MSVESKAQDTIYRSSRFQQIKRSTGPGELLASLGVPDAYHPQASRYRRAQCPLCEGGQTGTLSIAPTETGYGVWLCHRCKSGGDAFDLAQEYLGLSSKRELLQLCDAGRRTAATNTRPTPLAASLPDPSATVRRHRNLARAKRLIRGSIPFRESEIALRYLKSRGLSTAPADPAIRGLYFHPRAPYWQEGACTHHPALLAAIESPDDVLIGLHLTYLAADGHGKAQLAPARKLHPSWIKSSIRGAVRLVNADSSLPLIVGEGIETVLAARILSAERPDGPFPCWATLNTSLLKHFNPPPEVSRVIVATDHDLSGAGEKAARLLEFRLKESSGLRVEVRIPTRPGDWNDVLNRRNR